MTTETFDFANVSELVIYLDRFYLRTLTASDVSSDYLSWFDGDNVKKYISYASRAPTRRELLNYVNDKNSSKSALLFGIFSKLGSKHIGNIKYEPIDLVKKTADMGILIGDVNWIGRAAGPEVILGSTKWLKEQLSIEYITLGVHLENKSALKAYQKIGFIHDVSFRKSTNTNSMRMYLSTNQI